MNMFAVFVMVKDGKPESVIAVPDTAATWRKTLAKTPGAEFAGVMIAKSAEEAQNKALDLLTIERDGVRVWRVPR